MGELPEAADRVVVVAVAWLARQGTNHGQNIDDDQPRIGFAWGLAAVSATAAGVLWGGSQGIDWTLSLLLVKALAIAILGGLDSIAGVIIASIIVGVCEGLASGLLDPLVGGGTRDVVASVIILITLLLKSEGLFGREHIQRI